MRSGDYVTPTIKLVQHLGSGAMGSVWVAEHLALGTQVAVKLMMPAYAEDAEFVERFQQEARAAARIRSPHVVQMLDSGVTGGGAPYMVMELLEGETLGARVRRIGPLPLGEVVRIVVQAANALGRAHQLGIVHRDIKPENLFLLEVGGEPFVKVLDFGVAKQPPGTLRIMTETGRMMGTPLYMSPEQLVSAKHVDHRTDVWALAAVAYEALTARQPFQGESLGAQVLAVHTGGFLKPSAIRPGLPEAVDAWATRALQKDPDARFGSARELADALEEAARDVVVADAALAARSRAAFADTAPSQRADVEIPDERTLKRVEVLSASRLPVNPLIDHLPVAPIAPTDGTLVSAKSPWEGRERANATPEIRVGEGRIRLVLGRLVAAGVEAIVSATFRAQSGAGVDAAIRATAGPEIADELDRAGVRAEGSAVLTGAGRLDHPTRFILHTVAPAYDPERADECAALLRRAYLESLRLAEENSIHDVAFPAIGAGPGQLHDVDPPAIGADPGQFPIQRAASIALGAAIEHLAERARSVGLIVFVLPTHEHFMAFSTAMDDTAEGLATTPRG
jgi:serine/threonine protein kinase/O-acetyl-ADP-ribose deacetylase (regulator of RNase III)